MPYATGNKPFDLAVQSAELAFQNSKPFANQAAATAASKAYLQAVIAAGTANGVSTPNEQSALNAIAQTGAA